MKVDFITASRLPTERANGYCTVKTCEGLVTAGAQVELWYPERPQADALLRQDPLEYYGVRESFACTKMGHVGSLYHGRLDRYVGPLVTRARFGAWATQMAFRARADDQASCYTIDTEVALSMAIAGVPVAYEMHHPKRHGAARAAVRFVACRPRNPGIVALTEQLRAELIGAGVPSDAVQVIRHAFDPELYRTLPTRAEARRRLGLPLDRAIVGYVGRFHALGVEKGMGTLIDAMGNLRRLGHEPLLVLLGGPLSEEPGYREVAAAHGLGHRDVLFAGEVRNSDVPMWTRALDIATIPFPATEHFGVVSPLKLVEYMAAGTCVIATDLASIREEVEHDVTAWLVAPGVGDLTRGLRVLLEDEARRTRLGTAASASVAHRTWRARGGEIVEFLERRSPRSSGSSS